MGQFRPEELRLLAQTDEVEVEVRRESGGPGRRTTIWVVVDGDAAYIRSVRGAAGRWYQAVARGAAAILHAGDAAWPVQVAPVADAVEVARVRDAIRRKYQRSWPGPTAAMLREEVLPTTLRVEPA